MQNDIINVLDDRIRDYYYQGNGKNASKIPQYDDKNNNRSTTLLYILSNIVFDLIVCK